MLVRQLIKNYDKLGLWTSVFALGAFLVASGTCLVALGASCGLGLARS